MGDDPGTAESASELDVQHLSGIRVNEFGTPIVSDAIRLVREHFDSEIFVFCNCDVILTETITDAISQLIDLHGSVPFVAIGRRTELAVERALTFRMHGIEKPFLSMRPATGALDQEYAKSILCFGDNSIWTCPILRWGEVTGIIGWLQKPNEQEYRLSISVEWLPFSTKIMTMQMETFRG